MTQHLPGWSPPTGPELAMLNTLRPWLTVGLICLGVGCVGAVGTVAKRAREGGYLR